MKLIGVLLATLMAPTVRGDAFADMLGSGGGGAGLAAAPLVPVGLPAALGASGGVTAATLTAFFEANNPSKVAGVPKLMAVYVDAGHTDELISKLKAKYGEAAVASLAGSSPTVGAVTAAAAAATAPGLLSSLSKGVAAIASPFGAMGATAIAASSPPLSPPTAIGAATAALTAGADSPDTAALNTLVERLVVAAEAILARMPPVAAASSATGDAPAGAVGAGAAGAITPFMPSLRGGAALGAPPAAMAVQAAAGAPASFSSLTQALQETPGVQRMEALIEGNVQAHTGGAALLSSPFGAAAPAAAAATPAFPF